MFSWYYCQINYFKIPVLLCIFVPAFLRNGIVDVQGQTGFENIMYFTQRNNSSLHNSAHVVNGAKTERKK